MTSAHNGLILLLMVAVFVTSAPRQQGLEIKMKNTGSKLLKVGFNKDIDALRLASIIEKEADIYIMDQ